MAADTLLRPAPTRTCATDLVDRFLARLADWVALDVVLSLLLLGAPRPAATAVFAVLSLAYYVVAEVRHGRTVGKRLLRLRVVDADDGRRPTWRAALRRHLIDAWPVAYAVPWVGGVIGPLAVLLAVAAALAAGVALHRDARRGAWQDRWSGTRVVQERSAAQVQA